MDSSSRASTTATPRPTASPTRPSRWSCSRRAIAAARASRSAWAALSSESARPCSARARSSVVRSESRASISAARARAGLVGEPLAQSWCRAPRRGRPRRWPAATRARPAPRGRGRGPPGRPAIAWSRRSASARALRACEPYWPSSSATAARVASDSCSLARATSTRRLASSRSRSSVEASKVSRSSVCAAVVSCSVASSTAACTSIRLGWLDEPPAAKWAPSRSPSRVTAVTSGASATSDRAAARSSTTATLNSSRVSAGRRSVGALHHVHGVRRAGRQARPGGVVDVRATEQDPRATEVVVLEVADGAEGGVDVADGDRVGRTAEGSGDGRLVAGADAEQRGHRAEQAADRVGRGEQCPGAVLAVQAELERLLAGAQRGPLTLGGGQLLAGLGEPVLEVGEQRAGGLVLGVEALLPRVEARDPGLQRGEVVLGASRRGRRRRCGPR